MRERVRCDGLTVSREELVVNAGDRSSPAALSIKTIAKVIEQTIADAYGFSGSKGGPPRRRLASSGEDEVEWSSDEAQAWLMSPSDEWGSFRWYCRIAGCDPDIIARRIHDEVERRRLRK